MTRGFIATVLSLSLAFAGIGATPAQANDEELARLLFGLATIAIIGKAISDANDNDRYSPPPLQSYRQIPVRFRNLPAECLVEVNSRRGHVEIFAERCLQRNYRFADRLPAECYVEVGTRRHMRAGYSPSCLRRRGFRVERTR